MKLFVSYVNVFQVDLPLQIFAEIADLVLDSLYYFVLIPKDSYSSILEVGRLAIDLKCLRYCCFREQSALKIVRVPHP